MSIEFLVTSLIVIIAPGTGVLYTLAVALARGGRASIAAAFGCTLGIVPHIAAAVFGLAALLHASALAFQAVKYAGVAYLMFMAWNALREGGALKIEDKVDARSARQVIVTGILINLLNPKLTLFFLAFMPQFVDPGAAGATAKMLGLAAVFMAVTLLVFVAYGLLAAQARDHVITRPRAMRTVKRSFASMFALMGLRLALAER